MLCVSADIFKPGFELNHSLQIVPHNFEEQEQEQAKCYKDDDTMIKPSFLCFRFIMCSCSKLIGTYNFYSRLLRWSCQLTRINFYNHQQGLDLKSFATLETLHLPPFPAPPCKAQLPQCGGKNHCRSLKFLLRRWSSK